jgi:hypothetical protein
MSAAKTFVLRGEPNAQALWSFLKHNWRALADAGKPLSVSVAEHRAKRSGEQNRRLWALLNEIAEQAMLDGKHYSAEAWHEHFKRTLIGVEELPGGGSVGISTTTLNVEEFGAYMTRIEAYAAQNFGIEFRD